MAGPANGVGGKDTVGPGVEVRDGTYGKGGVCRRAAGGSAITGCIEGVVGADMATDTDMGDDEKGFVEKEVPFAANAWLNGFVVPRWSAGLDRGAEGAKGNCGPGVDADIGLATGGVVALAWRRDKFMNGFGGLPSVVDCC